MKNHVYRGINITPAGRNASGIRWHAFGPNGQLRAQTLDGMRRMLRDELGDPVRLECAHADTCLPDYWGGHHLPHVSVPVDRGMTFAKVREALHGELRESAIAGADATDDKLTGEWYAAAHAAVNRDIVPRKKGARLAFPHLEPRADDDEACESVYAYFVFLERAQ